MFRARIERALGGFRNSISDDYRTFCFRLQDVRVSLASGRILPPTHQQVCDLYIISHNFFPGKHQMTSLLKQKSFPLQSQSNLPRDNNQLHTSQMDPESWVVIVSEKSCKQNTEGKTDEYNRIWMELSHLTKKSPKRIILSDSGFPRKTDFPVQTNNKFGGDVWQNWVKPYKKVIPALVCQTTISDNAAICFRYRLRWVRWTSENQHTNSKTVYGLKTLHNT